MPGTSRPYQEPSTTALVSGDKVMVDSAARGTQQIDFDDLSTQFQLKSQRGAVGGYAELDSSGKVPATQLRSAYTIETVANAAARNALTVTTPQIAVRQVRLADTGVIYVPNAAGSGAGIWEVFNSVGVASSSAEGIVMLADSADASTDDAKALTIAESLRRLGPYRNSLAPAQALSGNGTAGSTLTLASAVGTSSASIPVRVLIPATNPGGDVGIFSIGANGAGEVFSVYISSNGKLNCALYGATASDYRLAQTDASIVASLGGTVAEITVVRDSSVPSLTIYANNVALSKTDSTGGTPPTWAGTMSSTTVYIGKFAASSGYFTGTIRLLGIENYALSTAQETYVYRTGSFPASDFNSASNTATYTSDFSAGVDLWGVAAGIASATGNVDGVGGLDNWLKYTLGATNALGIYHNTYLVAAAGKRYRYTFTIRHNSATVTSIKVYEYGNATNGVTGIAVAPNTNVTVTVDLPNPSAAANYLIIQTEQGMAIGELLYLRAFTSYNLGLLVAPDPAQPGNGLAWGDRSGNGAHILLPTSGVDWLLPSAAVNKLRGTTSTSGNQQLLGGTTLNANTQITHVRARSRSGTPSITLGTASGGSQIVASVALSTTWKDLTIALTGGIISTASSVWVGSSTADVVEIDLTHEPLGY